MKTLKITTILLIVGFIISACQRTETPESVVEKFVTSLDKGDYEKAKDLGTEFTKEIVEALQSFDEMNEQYGEVEKEEPQVIEDILCKVDNSNANCSYIINDEKHELDLLKEDGKWLVDLKKEAL